MEVFNPNPTIFVPTKSRQSQFAKPHSLWLDDPDNDRDSEDDESNEPEDIDRDEIFGTQATPETWLYFAHTVIFRSNKELIRSISDPEHRSMTLEQLAVVSSPQITFDPKKADRITVEFTPTVPHCGMSTFIGEHARCHFDLSQD